MHFSMTPNTKCCTNMKIVQTNVDICFIVDHIKFTQLFVSYCLISFHCFGTLLQKTKMYTVHDKFSLEKSYTYFISMFWLIRIL